MATCTKRDYCCPADLRLLFWVLQLITQWLCQQNVLNQNVWLCLLPPSVVTIDLDISHTVAALHLHKVLVELNANVK